MEFIICYRFFLDNGFSDIGFSDFGNQMTKKQLVILLFLQKIRYLHLKKHLGFLLSENPISEYPKIKK